jgi:hypothetical protein
VFPFAGWCRPSPPLCLLRRSGRTRPCPRGGACRERHGWQGARWRRLSHHAAQPWPRGRSRRRRRSQLQQPPRQRFHQRLPPPLAIERQWWKSLTTTPLPPGWGQWENWPAPAPEPATGVLVMREDGCVMPQHQTQGVEPSSSRAGPPAPNGTVARPKQEREHASVPQARRLAQQRAERGAAYPRGSCVADLLGTRFFC